MATDKRGRKLPRGVRQTQSGFEGRFMYKGRSYSVSGKTVREVAQRLTEAKYKAEHGVTVAPEVITFGDWAETWFREYYAKTVRDSTALGTRSELNVIILPALGDIRLSEVRAEHVQSLLNEMAAKQYNPTAIKKVRGRISRIFVQALRNDLVMRNPVEATVLPKATTRHPHIALTAAQQETFMQYAEESYFRDIYALALRTGLRHGEILALRTTDIDFRRNIIHVQRTMAYGAEGHAEHEPKTASSRRDIPMSSGTAQLLRSHIKAMKVIPSDLRLFCDYDGDFFREKRINADIRRIIQRIQADGIAMPDFSFHTFRHTFATRAIEAGMNPQTLKTILGHSSLAMTMDLYSHVMEDTRTREMELIDAMF